jgi:DNA-3-methyladenine glycosylase I
VAERKRCTWPGDDPLELAYHDEEWGVPVHDDHRLFESLVLGGAQAGLSWATILRKREGYRRAFAGFDPKVVARFDRRRVERLLADPGIVRNRQKVEAAVHNAQKYLEVVGEHGSFARWLWRFVDGKPVRNRWRTRAEVPARTDLSDAVSSDLKRRGFKFVGSTICYAILQGVGVVNDHTVDCFRWKELAGPVKRR